MAEIHVGVIEHLTVEVYPHRVCSRRRREFEDRVIGDIEHLHADIMELTRLVRLDLGVDMTTNDELATIKSNLTEATTELDAKIAELTAAVEAGETVDPQLLADVRSLSQGLADIVPDAPAEPPAETPPADGGETPPAAETPVEETP